MAAMMAEELTKVAEAHMDADGTMALRYPPCEGEAKEARIVCNFWSFSS
jgi:hypothetical protein